MIKTILNRNMTAFIKPVFKTELGTDPVAIIFFKKTGEKNTSRLLSISINPGFKIY